MGAWRLLLLAALPALVGVGAGAGEVLAVHEARPVFLPARRAVTAAPGSNVTLACRIAHLGDKAVSWVRARDLQILAHAGQVFSADPRVGAGVAATRGGVTHALRLASLRGADAGRYECQLNTEPKLSQVYSLAVTDSPPPRVEVSPVGALVVRGAAGGAASLGCAARLVAPVGAAPALALAWYRDGVPLLPQSERALGGVSLDTERAAGRVSSRLTLAALAPADAGRYTCRVTARAAGQPGEGEPGEPGEGEGEGEPGEGQGEGETLRGETALTLLVLEDADIGEMEAMQRDQSVPGAAAARGARAVLPALATLVASGYL